MTDCCSTYCSRANEIVRPGIVCLDPVLSWAFGIVLLISGIPHWANPYYFLGSVFGYNLFDPGLGQVVAMVLPTLQLILAVCLITRIWLDAAHLIVMAMFGSFAVVQSLAYFRGLDISCGCFGPCQQTPISATSLLFVFGLFLLSVARNLLRRRSLGSM
jgi:hypothetical protein